MNGSQSSFLRSVSGKVWSKHGENTTACFRDSKILLGLISHRLPVRIYKGSGYIIRFSRSRRVRYIEARTSIHDLRLGFSLYSKPIGATSDETVGKLMRKRPRITRPGTFLASLHAFVGALPSVDTKL